MFGHMINVFYRFPATRVAQLTLWLNLPQSPLLDLKPIEHKLGHFIVGKSSSLLNHKKLCGTLSNHARITWVNRFCRNLWSPCQLKNTFKDSTFKQLSLVFVREKRYYIWNKCTIEVNWQLEIECREISGIFSHLSPARRPELFL